MVQHLKMHGIPLPIKAASRAYGPTLEDAASEIPSSYVACGLVACEDKGVTISKVTNILVPSSLNRCLFEAEVRILDHSIGLFLEIVLFFPEGETIGMFTIGESFKPFK
jgi:hypothetical protein